MQPDNSYTIPKRCATGYGQKGKMDMKIKEYKVKRIGGFDNNGNAETRKELDTYEGVCYDLGFDASVHFVKITSAGTISFTCGKPHEIKALYRAVVNNGYVPSAELRNAVKN